jgi:squalene-hopene/tetraprenyl-beta-curcumene cyclase
MNIIKAFFNRLSDSLLSNAQGRFDPATEFTPVASLRLVSDKPIVLPSLDSSTVRRPIGHAVSQPDAVDDAIRRSQSWFFSRQHAEGYWVAELEADTTLTSE